MKVSYMYIDNNLLIIHDSADNNLKREMSLKKHYFCLIEFLYLFWWCWHYYQIRIDVGEVILYTRVDLLPCVKKIIRALLFILFTMVISNLLLILYFTKSQGFLWWINRLQTLEKVVATSLLVKLFRESFL